RYDPAAPPGHRVLGLRLEDGFELKPDLVYSVAVPADLMDAANAPPVLAQALVREDIGRAPAEALLDYLNTLPQPVRPPRDGRFRSAATAAGRTAVGSTAPPRPDNPEPCLRETHDPGDPRVARETAQDRPARPPGRLAPTRDDGGAGPGTGGRAADDGSRGAARLHAREGRALARGLPCPVRRH